MGWKTKLVFITQQQYDDLLAGKSVDLNPDNANCPAKLEIRRLCDPVDQGIHLTSATLQPIRFTVHPSLFDSLYLRGLIPFGFWFAMRHPKSVFYQSN